MKTITYFGYKITQDNWIETKNEYGQYDIFINGSFSKHYGYTVTKGRRQCGRAKTIEQCKTIIKKDRKYNSKKILNRIKDLKKLEKNLYKIAVKKEQSLNPRIRATADTFYQRSRKARHKAFNLEMGKSERNQY